MVAERASRLLPSTSAWLRAQRVQQCAGLLLETRVGIEPECGRLRARQRRLQQPVVAHGYLGAKRSLGDL